MAAGNNFNRVVSNVFGRNALDSICLMLVMIALVYELPASVIAEVGGAFGYFNVEAFIAYRLQFAALTIATCGLNILVNHRYLLKDKFFYLYVLMIGYMVLIVWQNRELYGYLRDTDQESVSAVQFWAPLIFKYILFFLIGFFLFRLQQFKHILAIFLFCSMALVMVNVDFDLLTINKAGYVDDSFKGHYLFLGDATSMGTLITIAFIKRNNYKILFTVMSCIAIFLIGSRTSFAVFTATAFLYFIISFKPSYLIGSVVILASMAIAFSSVDYSDLESRNSRMFSVFVDYGSDNSVIARETLAEQGWDDISDNLLAGRFGGQLTSGVQGIQSNWRSYIHNVFSYWRQFGILVMVFIFAFAARYAWLIWEIRENKDTHAFALSFLVGVFIAVETAFSRSFAFPSAHILFGLIVAMQYATVRSSVPLKYSARYYLRRVAGEPGRRSPKSVKNPRRSKRKYSRSEKAYRF